jgi:hypothetical protein
MYEIIYTQREREREKRYPLETLLDFEWSPMHDHYELFSVSYDSYLSLSLKSNKILKNCGGDNNNTVSDHQIIYLLRLQHTQKSIFSIYLFFSLV